MKKIVAIVVAFALLIGSPTVAMAKGYSGGRSYHSSYSGTGSGYGSGSHTYSSSGSLVPSSRSGGTYHSGKSTYSGGSTYRSGYTSSSSRTGAPFGRSYNNGSRFGLGHFGSFAGGFLLGSMFHPFGWGFGGGYYGGPGYFGGGWGGPGYSPLWSLVGLIVDLLMILLVIWIVYRLFRALARRRRMTYEPVYDIPSDSASAPFGQSYGSYSPKLVDLDEQAVADACCEFVSAREGCAPQDVDVDLTFERDMTAFGANIRVDGRISRFLNQQDLVDALAEFVASRERISARNVDVDLKFNEQIGVHASARIQ